MGDEKIRNDQSRIARLDSVMRYARLIEKQTGKAVRPYRADGYVNLMNRYGTSKDPAEQYKFSPEPAVPDEILTMFYEGNGLFSKIIDTPAEEAVKHGFTLEDVSDQKVLDFCYEALDELDWEETAMTALKWARLFGGSIAVMLINDGRGIDEPLDWSNIQSIDDIRVYDRSLIRPDYSSMFSYDPQDPFRTRGSRLGMPEYYTVFSRYGNFTVHDSRCLVFQNGILPENCTNSEYQLWGMPEYVRIHRAIRDAELAHGSGPKMLDKSVQAVYKMSNLASELASEEGEDRVLKRLQVIDMARGLLNSIAIDRDGEEYDFKTFQFAGVADVINATCNYLSSLSNIPQTILFGRSPAGMNATGDADFENFYNYCERIQRRTLRGNIRYLLSVICQAGVSTGEIEEVPKIKIKFNPLWSLSDTEQAALEQQRAATQQSKAQTAQIYVDMGAIDPSEIRKKLAESEEFDVENMLDDIDEEDLFAGMETQQSEEAPEETITPEGVIEEGNSPDAAPAATKLPQDMTEEDKKGAVEARIKAANGDSSLDTLVQRDGENAYSVGVLVISGGRILCGTRTNDFGSGLICGPGGHIEDGETPENAAIRETQEEFGITPKTLILLGLGPVEPDTGLRPIIYLCDEFEGEPICGSFEMRNPVFFSLEELDQLLPSLFQPFADSLTVLKEKILRTDSCNVNKRRNPLTNAEKSSTLKMMGNPLQFRLAADAEDEDVEWITVNGAHIPLKDGQAAAGGDLKGKDLSRAKSEGTEKGSSGGSNGSGENGSDKKSGESAPKPSKKLAVPEGADLRSRILADTEGKMTADDILSDPVIQSAIARYEIDPAESTHLIDTPEREQLRQQVADDIAGRGSISGYDEEGKPIYDGEVEKGYRAEIVIGPPAAGKSSVIVDGVSQHTKSRVLDSDEVKALLPEFEGGSGAGRVHEESSEILSQRVIPQFLQGGQHQGDNIVLPIVGGNAGKVESYLSALRAAGYEVHLSFNDVSAETSMKRAMVRYIDTGRFIDPTYIASIGRRPERTYEAMKKNGGFASYSRYSNEVPKGQPATKVERVNSNGENIGWEDWQ